MTEKFYLTTAIAYPNSKPHLGHALEMIQADVVARFQRLLGKEVTFQTGTDEYGVKNWQTAQKEGKKITQFLDDNVNIFKELFKKLNISYDFFIRTTDEKVHHPGVLKLWKELVKSGDIYKHKYKGSYCSGCEVFKTEKELENGKCPNHPTRDIETVEEENYFFKLSNYKEQVSKIIESGEYKIIPETRKNEILSFLKEVKDISFSRSKESLPWGIPVPDDDEQVMYVWCDALSNYITGAGYGTDKKKFQKLWPADLHIIGKDILRFHAGFWPSMLLSAKIPLPKELLVHGFILSKGTKMSKSTGNVVEPFDQIEKYGVEPFRFYIVGTMPMDGDGEYSEELLVERVNTELVSNLANFVYRTLSFLNKNFSSKLGNKVDEHFLNRLKGETKEIIKNYEEYELRKVVNNILALSSEGNKYFQDRRPWDSVHENDEECLQVLTTCTNLVKDLAILIKPILPEYASEIETQLNIENLNIENLSKDLTDHKINEAKIVYEKIDLQAEKEASGFDKLNLKVALVEEVIPHPNADKLYVLKLNLGEEKRQIVAGLKEYYSPEELTGKKVVIVSNLEYAKLRGEESQGMMLAAEGKTRKGEDSVGLLYVNESEPGDQVSIKGSKPNDKKISFDEFMKYNINVNNGDIFFEDKKLKTSKEFVMVEKVLEGKVR